MKKLLSLLIVTALVLTNSFSIAFADEIENTETTTTLDSSIFEDLDYSYLGEECNETNIETDYNLYDELDYHDCEAVYDWIYETYNVSHSDEEANQFIWNNINKFVLLAIENEVVVYPKMSLFWNLSGHSNTFTKAMEALSSYNTTIYNFYKNSSCYSDMASFTKEPDTTEKASGTHYYVYTGDLSSNDGYYANRYGDYAVSARTRFEEHYFTAVNLYKNGFKEEAIKELCYAIHYLQDIGCPPHTTTDMADGFLGDDHTGFEDYVRDTYIKNYYSNSNCVLSTATISDVSNKNIGTNLNALAKKSRECYDQYVDDGNNSTYKTAASIMLPFTQKYVTAYLVKFYNDVKSSSTTYIQNNQTYYIKNKDNGKYLCINNNQIGWSTSLTNNCRFTFKLASGGYYNIMCGESSMLRLGGVSTTNDGHSQFRLINNENGYYKILIKSLNVDAGTIYKNELSFNSYGLIARTLYPSDNCGYWKIERF